MLQPQALLQSVDAKIRSISGLEESFCKGVSAAHSYSASDLKLFGLFQRLRDCNSIVTIDVKREFLTVPTHFSRIRLKEIVLGNGTGLGPLSLDLPCDSFSLGVDAAPFADFRADALVILNPYLGSLVLTSRPLMKSIVRNTGKLLYLSFNCISETDPKHSSLLRHSNGLYWGSYGARAMLHRSGLKFIRGDSAPDSALSVENEDGKISYRGRDSDHPALEKPGLGFFEHSFYGAHLERDFM